MRFQIRTAYDCTATLMDWENFPPADNDQYIPRLSNQGQINCSIGVDPTTGNMVMQVADLLSIVGVAVITDAHNRDGKEITAPDTFYRASYPIPQINAYGQIYAYNYRLAFDRNVN